MMTTLGQDIDIRSDVPSYNIYCNGQLTNSCSDITHLWQDNMVALRLVVHLPLSMPFYRPVFRSGMLKITAPYPCSKPP